MIPSNASALNLRLEKFPVSLYSIHKSRRVLYAFTQFYLPVYGRDLKFFFLDHYDVFGCFSAAIYEIDEMIEVGTALEDVFQRLDQILYYLATKIDCDEYVHNRFEDARRYYRFEADLIRGVARYSLLDLITLTEIRSFDFRIMHRALALFSGLPYDERVFEWFHWFETQMEIEDDLLSAREDMDRGTHNIFCLAKTLSPDTASGFIEEYRSRIDQNLSAICQMIPAPRRDIWNQTLTAYRRIVPRPDLPFI